MDTFRPCYRPFLMPLVFDDSLTYYEQLCVISKKLNEIITEIDKLGENTIDQQIAQLRQYVDMQDNVTLAKAGIYTDDEISRLELVLYQQITIVTNLCNKTNSTTREWVALQLDIFKNEIRNIPLPSIFNPLTGRYDSMQKVISDMYDYLRPEALTALGYDELYLTAGEFDGKQLTALQYDLYSKQILYSEDNKIRSPFTGDLDGMENIILLLANLHQLTLTAGQRDALDRTAGTYDSANKTAYYYDWEFTN